VLVSDQCNDIACSIEQGLAVLASAKVELEPFLELRLNLVVYKVRDPPPHLEATDLDDCSSFQHDLSALCSIPSVSVFKTA
jgi:hypothetical protein